MGIGYEVIAYHALVDTLEEAARVLTSPAKTRFKQSLATAPADSIMAWENGERRMLTAEEKAELQGHLVQMRFKWSLATAMECLNDFANPEHKNFTRREVYAFVDFINMALGSATTDAQTDEIRKQLGTGYRTMFAQLARDQIEAMATKCGRCLGERVESVDLVNGVCPKCGADYPAITPKEKEAELEKLEQSIREHTRFHEQMRADS